MPLFHPTVATTTTSSTNMSVVATETAPVSSSVAKATATALWKTARSIRTTSSNAALASASTWSTAGSSSSTTASRSSTVASSISTSASSTATTTSSECRDITARKRVPSRQDRPSLPRVDSVLAPSPAIKDNDVDYSTLTIPCSDTRSDLLQLLAFLKSVPLQDRKKIKRIELKTKPGLYVGEIDEACAQTLDRFSLATRCLLRLGLEKEQIWLNCFVWADGGEAHPNAEDYWEGKEEVVEEFWMELREMEDVAFGWDDF